MKKRILSVMSVGLFMFVLYQCGSTSTRFTYSGTVYTLGTFTSSAPVGAAGVTVTILQSDGTTVIATGTTAADGTFSIISSYDPAGGYRAMTSQTGFTMSNNPGGSGLASTGNCASCHNNNTPPGGTNTSRLY